MINITPGWDKPLDHIISKDLNNRPSHHQGIKTLIRMAKQHGGNLFILADTIRDNRLLQLLPSAKEEYRFLYQGTKQEKFLIASPVLISCKGLSKLASRLIGDSWGKRVAIYLTTKSNINDILVHLQQFSIVEDIHGVQFFLRLADPLILHTLIASATETERQTLFGPIDCFMLSSCPSEILYFTQTNDITNQSKNSHKEGVSTKTEQRFVIKQHLENAFSKMSLIGFYWRACKNLRQRCEHFLSNMSDDKIISTIIIPGIKEAQQYGCNLEDDALNYLELSIFYLAHSQDIKNDTRVTRILQEKKSSFGNKIKSIRTLIAVDKHHLAVTKLPDSQA